MVSNSIVEEWTTVRANRLKPPNDKTHVVVCDTNFADLSVHLAGMNGFATLSALNQIIQGIPVFTTRIYIREAGPSEIIQSAPGKKNIDVRQGKPLALPNNS
jgi:hypothetical protein